MKTYPQTPAPTLQWIQKNTKSLWKAGSLAEVGHVFFWGGFSLPDTYGLCHHTNHVAFLHSWCPHGIGQVDAEVKGAFKGHSRWMAVLFTQFIGILWVNYRNRTQKQERLVDIGIIWHWCYLVLHFPHLFSNHDRVCGTEFESHQPQVATRTFSRTLNICFPKINRLLSRKWLSLLKHLKLQPAAKTQSKQVVNWTHEIQWMFILHHYLIHSTSTAVKRTTTADCLITFSTESVGDPVTSWQRLGVVAPATQNKRSRHQSS